LFVFKLLTDTASTHATSMCCHDGDHTFWRVATSPPLTSKLTSIQFILFLFLFLFSFLTEPQLQGLGCRTVTAITTWRCCTEWEKLISFSSSCLISILIAMFLGTLEPKPGQKQGGAFFISFKFTIFYSFRGGLYPRDWHTCVNWRLDCSCEALTQTLVSSILPTVPI
jgi:hypothetical protein